MRSVIVLAMHGVPPRDFPREELAEFFGLHSQLAHGSRRGAPEKQKRFEELEAKLRNWPRSLENDPFFAASQKLASHLSQASGKEVFVGFNEFCAPSLDEAFDRAVEEGADRVMVITPMMTRGGEHSEIDIPEAIERGKKRHPQVHFIYAWPFPESAIAQFLAERLAQFI
jgi:sirohydrochlorin cobaltochelatase